MSTIEIHGAAADPGESSAWALCRAVRGSRPVLVALHPVHGDEHLWWPRAVGGARLLVAAAGGPCPCRVEVPPPVVHSGAMAHHRTGHGLGMRAGLLRAAWWSATGELPATWEPGEWWRPFGLRGKREAKGVPKGWHRVGEAGLYVDGAANALTAFPVTRRVDAAEAVLQAAALVALAAGGGG